LFSFVVSLFLGGFGVDFWGAFWDGFWDGFWGVFWAVFWAVFGLFFGLFFGCFFGRFFAAGFFLVGLCGLLRSYTLATGLILKVALRASKLRTLVFFVALFKGFHGKAQDSE